MWPFRSPLCIQEDDSSCGLCNSPEGALTLVKEALWYDLPFCTTRVGRTLASLCIAPMHVHVTFAPFCTTHQRELFTLVKKALRDNIVFCSVQLALGVHLLRYVLRHSDLFVVPLWTFHSPLCLWVGDSSCGLCNSPEGALYTGEGSAAIQPSVSWYLAWDRQTDTHTYTRKHSTSINYIEDIWMHLYLYMLRNKYASLTIYCKKLMNSSLSRLGRMFICV